MTETFLNVTEYNMIILEPTQFIKGARMGNFLPFSAIWFLQTYLTFFDHERKFQLNKTAGILFTDSNLATLSLSPSALNSA